MTVIETEEPGTEAVLVIVEVEELVEDALVEDVLPEVEEEDDVEEVWDVAGPDELRPRAK